MNAVLERNLWSCLERGGSPADWIDAALACGSIKSRKQAVRVLEKWATCGLYEYGVHVERGWIVSEAKFPR